MRSPNCTCHSTSANGVPGLVRVSCRDGKYAWLVSRIWRLQPEPEVEPEVEVDVEVEVEVERA